MNTKLFNQNSCYIIGVSGGSDSMALLSMCLAQNIKVIVAHVNYQKRITAIRDYLIVKQFCEDNDLILEYQIATGMKKGNFQEWARDQRYQFFKELTIKYQAAGVIVAHHQDDLLETYLIQKNRKNVPLYWGIKEETIVNDLRIYRPLLDYRKLELEEYCLEHQVIYGDDESNFTDDYTRNKIRHTIIDNMSETDRNELLVKITVKNEQLLQKQLLAKEAYDNCFYPFKANIYKTYKPNIRYEALRKYLISEHIDAKHYTIAHLCDLDDFICKKGNRELRLSGNLYLGKSYDDVEIYNKKELEYNYTLMTNSSLITPYFTVTNQGLMINAVTVSPDDYPLTIRNWHPQDSIQLRFGQKKINRWFIDRKIPMKERYCWPILLNSSQEVILVPSLGCNIAHFSNIPNMFVLKL